MILSTMNDLPGYEITEVIGEVFGITVRSRHIGSQAGARTRIPPAVSPRRAGVVKAQHAATAGRSAASAPGPASGPGSQTRCQVS